MKKTDSPDKRLRLYEILASVLIFAILIGWALALNLTAGDRELTAAQKRMFAVAEVTDVLADNASPDTWTEGRRIGQQLLEVKVLTGENKGAVLEVTNFLSAYANVDAKVGTRVIVRLDVDDQGELYVVSVPAYNRAPVMLGLALIFAALLVIIGRKKGVMALVGLVYTLACIWFIQVPMILRGAEPILVSVIIVALTTAASLLFLTGLSRKTLCAVLGCVCGVGVAGIFAAVSGSISQLNGFNLPEAEDLVLRSTQDTVRISGLLVSGILVASLGAVMDVAMSIASSCWELRQLNPAVPKADIFRSGMNIGRDAMGTMANTLILAFAGASLNTLLLFRIYGYPAIQLFNSDAIAVELIRGLAGSIGIILTVPLVAALSAALMPPVKGRLAKQR